jgi:predicted metal-dependent enzyme (double-stranded beta helix superfamily)
VSATEQSYSISEFVDDLRQIVAAETDNAAIVKRVMPLAKRIGSDPAMRRSEFYDCDEEQGFGINILHEEDDHSLLVEAIAWLPGRGVKPHDHQTWGVVVGLDGRETNVNWLRRDDGTKPGFADIYANHEVDVGPGDVVAFMPDDIHSVRNDGDSTTLSLHIYGKSLAHIERSEFDPETKVQRLCPKRKRKRD